MYSTEHGCISICNQLSWWLMSWQVTTKLTSSTDQMWSAFYWSKRDSNLLQPLCKWSIQVMVQKWGSDQTSYAKYFSVFDLRFFKNIQHLRPSDFKMRTLPCKQSWTISKHGCSGAQTHTFIVYNCERSELTDETVCSHNTTVMAESNCVFMR